MMMMTKEYKWLRGYPYSLAVLRKHRKK